MAPLATLQLLYWAVFLVSSNSQMLDMSGVARRIYNCYSSTLASMSIYLSLESLAELYKLRTGSKPGSDLGGETQFHGFPNRCVLGRKCVLALSCSYG